ncbi:MAG: M20/M25/M40 family metallo-hydrolase [Acidobacteria bacterium]|nr:M20/M25/M40 family metallo-hydrolase [Acidobacteriota bacterium]
MKRMMCMAGWVLGTAIAAAGQTQTGAAPLAPLPVNAAVSKALQGISAEQVKGDIAKLVSFGTRNTLSSMDTTLPPGQGINAAADWITSEFQAISAQCGGCLEVKRDEFVQPTTTTGYGRIPSPTKLVNVYAILHGTGGDKAPWVLVTGHYDSRATDVMNDKLTSPGANDDASGVAVSIESARALSGLGKAGVTLTGTMVFVAVAGEEQGLYGSRHLAQLAKSEGWPLEAVLNDDIVGGDTTPGETMQKKDVVRVFSESIPATATPEQQRMMLGLGAEGDSPSRELARQIVELAPSFFKPMGQHPPVGRAGEHNDATVPAFHPVMVLRRDRYLRGGDHSSFNAEGFTAVRFTEWRENFDHQHQTLRTENGVEYGDLLKFVDFNYVVRVAQLNALTMASLAAAPSEPHNVRILTKALDNNSELTWEAPAFAPAGTTYEVVWRDTDEPEWTHSQSAGAETHLKLNVSKDDVLFGVRAVSAAGDASLPVPPLPAR